MAKYVSRFALGLSNSVPGLLVDQSNIRFIDDISKLVISYEYALSYCCSYSFRKSLEYDGWSRQNKSLVIEADPSSIGLGKHTECDSNTHLRNEGISFTPLVYIS